VGVSFCARVRVYDSERACSLARKRTCVREYLDHTARRVVEALIRNRDLCVWERECVCVCVRARELA